MIFDRGKIRVDNGVEYIMEWTDDNGRCKFDQYLTNGKMIVNKVMTGCGFTTYSLKNQENTILVSPRIRLLQEKERAFNQNNNQLCYYFNRERDYKNKEKKSIEQLVEEFKDYKQLCDKYNRPMKLMVTYDSFANLMTMLERVFELDINLLFRIVIDESHTIIKDVLIKEYNNKCVLSAFLHKLFQYEKLLFISATPIIDYMQEVPEFAAYNVEYVELDWPNKVPIDTRHYSCKNAKDAFNSIYSYYSRHIDPHNRHYFDVIHYGEGLSDYSYEAVVFLNSVDDIKDIVSGYVTKKQLIDISEITVICANTKENATKLRKAHPQLEIKASIPQKGERHTTWTFVTRTAFEGVDFYSPCASTYVIANYYVGSLQLDIASDIPQIIGRQRLKTNVFRNILHIYYKENISIIDDDLFEAKRKEKMERSLIRISNWTYIMDDQGKSAYLHDVSRTIDDDPNYLYIKTVNGKPEIDNLIIVSENYCRDILKNHISWYCMGPAKLHRQYSPQVMQLKDNLEAIATPKKNQDRIKAILYCFQKHPECQREIFGMLHDEGYNDVAYYFNMLSTERIIANGCDPWKMDQELRHVSGETDIKDLVASLFENGEVYSKKDVKWMLQEVYDKMGIAKTAKASELPNYIPCKITNKDGLKAYRITI